VPGIDFGDAPNNNYNISTSPASTAVPAFHVVPSAAANVKVYLGSNKPDLDYTPIGNAAATLDDVNGTPDDEDCLPFTTFPV